MMLEPNISNLREKKPRSTFSPWGDIKRGKYVLINPPPNPRQRVKSIPLDLSHFIPYLYRKL